MDSAGPVPAAAPMMAMRKSAESAGDFAEGLSDKASAGPVAPPKSPDLSKVTARKNLNETAFFFPKLISSEDGEVRMEFTMPEALTKWKFLGFAHDKAMRSGFLTDSMVTAKGVMVQPNPPRFLREGDRIEFTVKVSNQSPTIRGGGSPDFQRCPNQPKRGRESRQQSDRFGFRSSGQRVPYFFLEDFRSR